MILYPQTVQCHLLLLDFLEFLQNLVRQVRLGYLWVPPVLEDLLLPYWQYLEFLLSLCHR